MIQSITKLDNIRALPKKAFLIWLAWPSIAAILCSLKSCNGIKFSLFLGLTDIWFEIMDPDDPTLLMNELELALCWTPTEAEFNLLAVFEVWSILLFVKIRLFIGVVKLVSANNPLQSGWSQRQTVVLIMLTKWLEQSWLTAGALLHLRLVTETEMKDFF